MTIGDAFKRIANGIGLPIVGFQIKMHDAFDDEFAMECIDDFPNTKWILLPFFILVVDTSVRAELVISPQDVPPARINLLMDGNPFELDATVTINNASTFGGKFYGAPVGPVTVAENGNLNFSNNGFFFPFGFTETNNVNYTARIAPLWDDVLLFQPFNNRVIEHSVPGSYLAVTWENVLLFNDSLDNPLPQQSFQVLWFEAPTNIGGFNFFADDIVFGYRGSVPGANSFGDIEGTVGITNGAGLFTPLPGDTPTLAEPNGDGYINYFDGQNNLLAWESDTFLLFRPKSDPTTGYTASKERFLTAVPEPTTGLCMLALLVGWVGLHRRRIIDLKNRPLNRLRRRNGSR